MRRKSVDDVDEAKESDGSEPPEAEAEKDEDECEDAEGESWVLF